MRQVILVGAMVAGLGAVALGLMAAAALTLLGLLGGAEANGLLLAALGLGAGGFGVALGLLLAWEAWRGLQGKPSGIVRLPAWGWWLGALITVLLVGQVLYRLAGAWPLTFFHLLAAVIPALLFLSLSLGGARRRGGTTTERPVVSAIAWGGLGGVSLALLVELALLGAMLLILRPLLGLVVPGFNEHMQALLAAIQQGREVDLRLLEPYLRSPWLLAGGLLLASVFVPLIEEAVKALAVPLVILAGRRVTRLDAFLIGVAAGAGFAMVEGVSNGALGLAAPENWATAMATRAAAAALHCVVSGLAGLGWHAIIVERNWLRGLGLGLAAVAYHGLWNLAALGSAWLSLQRGLDANRSLPGNLLSLPIVALFGFLFLLALVILRWLPARLAAEQAGTESSTPS